MPSAPSEPHVSIVIPVYNEEGMLHSAVVDLVDRMKEFDFPYELILSENGSTDGTVEAARRLAERFPQISMLSAGEPNYGLALRNGILVARGEYVICDEIDLCDTEFYARALSLLEPGEADLVVGSKSMPGACDERPPLRRAGTVILNGLLRVSLGFKGTDTHGLKAFRRDALIPYAEACLVDKDIFASELVIRAERGGVGIREIPVRVLEKRPPTIGLLRRVPNVLKNLARLVVAIRIRG